MTNDERAELEEIRSMPASQLEESIKADGGNPDEMAERARLAIERALDARGLLTDLEAFEGWAVRALLADRDREGRVWFFHNGGDGLYPAFLGGMEHAKSKADKAHAAPRWWKCDTHGPAKAGAWGCPDCVREMRDEAASFHMAYRMKCDEETKAQAEEIERLRARLDDALFVLGMVDKNNRIDAGEKGKAWSGRFVVEEVRRVLTLGPNVRHNALARQGESR